MAASLIRRRLTYGPNRRGEETYRVTDVTTPEAAQNHPDVPDYLDPFSGSPVLRASEFETEYIESAKGDAWDVTVRYEPNRLQGGSDPGSDDPADINYTEINVDQEAAPYEAWRVPDSATGFLLEPASNDATGTTGDIGGNAIDSAGEPTTIFRTLPVVRISHTIGWTPAYGAIRSLAGTRNNTTFLLAARGTLLYRGATSRSIGPYKYTVDHTFHYDDWYHLVQVPYRSTDGVVTTELSLNQNQADTVYWKQPFPLYGNFGQLSIPI